MNAGSDNRAKKMFSQRLHGGVKTTALMLMVCILAGCWDYMPLEEKFIVNAIGIDISEEDPSKLSVTVMGVTYQESNEALTAEGESITDAIRNIRDRTDKSVTLSHIQVVLFAEQVARRSITPYLDAFYRDPQVRSDAVMAVVIGEARDFLDVKKMKHPINGKYIHSIVTNSETNIGEHSYDIQSVVFEMEQNEVHFSLPVLRYEPKQKVISFSGVGLFADGKMVATLGMNSSIGFFMLNGKLKSSMMTTGSIDVTNKKEQAVTFRLFGPKRNVKWVSNDDKPAIQVELSFKDEILEVNPWHNSKLSIQQFEQMERDMEEEIRKLLQQVLHVVQFKHKMELFHFRNMARVYWKEGYDEQQWHQQFSRIPVNLKVDVQVERTGLVY